VVDITGSEMCRLLRAGMTAGPAAQRRRVPELGQARSSDPSVRTGPHRGVGGLIDLQPVDELWAHVLGPRRVHETAGVLCRGEREPASHRFRDRSLLVPNHVRGGRRDCPPHAGQTDRGRVALNFGAARPGRSPTLLRSCALCQGPQPSRDTWPVYQPVGEQLWREGSAGIIAPSAAHPGSLMTCVFAANWPPVGCTPLDAGTVGSIPPPSGGMITRPFRSKSRGDRDPQPDRDCPNNFA